MKPDLANFAVDRVIAHQIHLRGLDRRPVSPSCSQSLTRLGHEGRLALESRLTSALGDNSHAIQMEISRSDAGSAFQLLSCCLDGDDKRLVENSELLARSLTDAQASRRIPGGVFLVMNGTAGSSKRRFAAIVKAETDEGFVAKHGGGNVDLEFLASLFMTAQQKLYKIGFFLELQPGSKPEDGLRNPADFLVLVYDHNMTIHETGKAALYFYDTFLGCTSQPTAAALTRDFYYQTRDFIATSSMPDHAKADGLHALYTYLRIDQRRTLKVSEFASQYLDKALRDPYRTWMRDRDFPLTAVPKDTSNLTRVLKKRTLHFTSNVQVSAPSDGFNDRVVFEEIEDRAFTHLKIAGRLSSSD